MAAVAAALVLAACSGGSSGTTATTAAATTTTDAEPTTTTTSQGALRDDPAGGWVRVSPRPHSRVVSSGGLALYIGVAGDDLLEVVAVEPRTGQIAWSRPTRFPARFFDMQVGLLADADTVYMVDARNNLLAVDSASGEVVWEAELRSLALPSPFFCGDDVCTVVSDGDKTGVARVDTGTGFVESFGLAGLEFPLAVDNGRELSASTTLDVALTDKGAQTELWRRPGDEVFGPGHALDYGWAGQYSDGVWVAWVSHSYETEVGVTVGLGDDGTVLWSRTDTMPCRFLLDEDRAPAIGGPIVLCRGRNQIAGYPSYAYVLNVDTIEGVDPVTGTTTWSVTSPWSGEAPAPGDVVRTGPTTFLLRTSEGDVALDLTNGPSPAGADQSGWCRPAMTTDYVDETYGSYPYSATPAPYPCELGGEPIEIPEAVPEFAGASVDGFGVWVEDRTVRGAELATTA